MYKILDNQNIEEVLCNNFIGRIACCDGHLPYIVPITYCYDKASNSIIGYSGEGAKIDILRKNPSVCFEVDEIKNITSWKSVVAHGVYTELKGADSRNAVHVFVSRLRELIGSDHHVFIKDLSSSVPDEKEIVVYRINLSKKTGRYQGEAKL